MWSSVAIPERGSVGTPISSSPRSCDERRSADRDQHQVGLDGLAFAEADDEVAAGVLDAGALLLEMNGDLPPLERLQQLLRCIGVLLRDERGQHLDDGHLAAEMGEDRRELAADDAAAEHDEAPRHFRLGEQAGGVDAPRASRGPGSAAAPGRSRWRRSRS